jgi:hypothetical protein
MHRRIDALSLHAHSGSGFSQRTAYQFNMLRAAHGDNDNFAAVSTNMQSDSRACYRHGKTHMRNFFMRRPFGDSARRGGSPHASALRRVRTV